MDVTSLSPTRLVRAGALHGLGGRAVAATAQFASAVIVARLLGPAGLGTFAAASAVVALATTVGGMQVSTQASRSGSRAFAGEVWPWSWLLGAVIAATVLVIAGVVGLSRPMGRTLLALTPIALVGPAVGLLTGGFAAAKRVRGAVAMTTYPPVARLIVLVAVAAVTATLTPPAVGIIDAAISVSLLALGSLWLRPWRDRAGRLGSRALRLVVANGLPLTASALAWATLSRVDVLMVNWLLGPSPTGRYQVAVKLSEVPLMLYAAALVMFLPATTQADDGDQLRVVYSDATYLMSWLLLPMLVGLAAFGDVVVPVVFGTGFQAGVLVYVLVAAGIAAQITTGPTGLVLIARRRHAWLVGMAIGLLVMDVALNAALIPLLGLSGAAGATALSYLVLNSIALGVARRHLGTRPWLRRYAVWLVIYAGGLLLGFGIARVVLGPTLIGVVAGTLAGLGVAYVAHRLRAADQSASPRETVV